MRVKITLGVLCTATGRANPTFFPHEKSGVRMHDGVQLKKLTANSSTKAYKRIIEQL